MLDEQSRSWGIDDRVRALLDTNSVKKHVQKHEGSKSYLASAFTSRGPASEVLEIHRKAYEDALREVGE
jgi:hypothetical protein